jgi:hypothetical protein
MARTPTGVEVTYSIAEMHQVCSLALFEGSGVAALVEENRGRSATSAHKGAGEPIEVYDAGMGP